MSDASFMLHPRLAADCTTVADLPVSRLLLMDDQRFPWCILVPRMPGLRELHELGADRWHGLFREIDALSRSLLDLPGITKINIGALGNLVEQLHVHVVGRHPADTAWPGPVWGSGPAEPYPPAEHRALCDRLRRALTAPDRD